MIYEHIVEGDKKFYTFKDENDYDDNENIQNYTNDPRWPALKAKIDAGATVQPYISSDEYLTTFKKKKKLELASKRKQEESKDINFNGITFRCDRATRDDVLAVVVESILDNSGFIEHIPDSSGNLVELNDTDAQALGKAMKLQVKNARVNYRAKKAEIDALTTIAEVESYDINTGW